MAFVGKIKILAGTQHQYAEHRKALGWTGATDASVSRNVSSGKLRPSIQENGWIDFEMADKLWPGGFSVEESRPSAPEVPRPAKASEPKPEPRPASSQARTPEPNPS